MQLDFTSFSTDDDDYTSYDYSLTGQLSEVRIVYLNRFVQEVSCFEVNFSLLLSFVIMNMMLEMDSTGY